MFYREQTILGFIWKEADGILKRKIYAEIPPRVEYFITEKGKSLFWVIESLKVWGEENMPE